MMPAAESGVHPRVSARPAWFPGAGRIDPSMTLLNAAPERMGAARILLCKAGCCPRVSMPGIMLGMMSGMVMS